MKKLSSIFYNYEKEIFLTTFVLSLFAVAAGKSRAGIE